MDGVSLFSFQHEVRPTDVAAIENGDMYDIGRSFKSYADTLANIIKLDLLISVDTSVLHLAASLGIPTWALIPAYGTDWRWQTVRTDNPWYPSIKLYRQQKRGDWDSVIDRVARDLRALVKQREAA
jgi:ADP-heptose:LPS heptosyltransferase